MGIWTKSFIFGFLLLLVANILYLDISFMADSDKNSVNLPFSLSKNSSNVIPTPIPSPIFHCGDECKEIIQNQIITLIPTQPHGIGGPDFYTPSVAQTFKPQLREFYIPFGSGKTTKKDWEDMGGTDTIINTENYPSDTKAFFEASLYIPTGNGKASARLYNVTDKHPAWFAEVSTESIKPVVIRSNKIVLDKGNKLYRVQLVSSLGVEAILDFARVKIVVE